MIPNLLINMQVKHGPNVVVLIGMLLLFRSVSVLYPVSWNNIKQILGLFLRILLLRG